MGPCMQCPACLEEHPSRPSECPRTGLVVPTSLEGILGVRRLSAHEVLRLGLLVCDRWRRQGVDLADIRSRHLRVDYDGALVFGGITSAGKEPDYVGLRALGGVMARCLDRNDPAAAQLAGFLEDLAGASQDVSVTLVRAEIHQRLAGATDEDPLEAHTWADDNPPVPSDGDPTEGIEAVVAPVVDPTGPTVMPVSINPTGENPADPYADTYIRTRSELFPDMATDPTALLDRDLPAEPLSAPLDPRHPVVPSLEVSRDLQRSCCLPRFELAHRLQRHQGRRSSY